VLYLLPSPRWFFLDLFFETSHRRVILNLVHHLSKYIEEKREEAKKNGLVCGFMSNALLQINHGFSCTARYTESEGV
jgi:hypothetical protein